MESLLDTAENYVRILRVCRTGEVSEWKKNDLERALNWSKHLAKAYEKLLLAKPRVQQEFKDKFDQRMLISPVRVLSGDPTQSESQMFGCETLSLEFLGTKSYDYLIKSLLENPSLCVDEAMKLPELASQYSVHQESVSQKQQLLQGLSSISSVIKDTVPHLPAISGDSVVVATAFMEEFKILKSTLTRNRRAMTTVMQKRFDSLTDDGGLESILICLVLHCSSSDEETASRAVQDDIIQWLMEHFDSDLTHSFAEKFFSLSPQTLAYVAERAPNFKKVYLQELISVTDLMSVSSISSGTITEEELASHWIMLAKASSGIRESITSVVEKRAVIWTSQISGESKKFNSSTIWLRLFRKLLCDNRQLCSIGKTT